MTREEKRDRLQELMTRHSLTYKAVAGLVHHSVNTCISWTRPTDNKSSREIPLGYIELIEYKLGERK